MNVSTHIISERLQQIRYFQLNLGTSYFQDKDKKISNFTNKNVSRRKARQVT